jgi:hypothetical protein
MPKVTIAIVSGQKTEMCFEESLRTHDGDKRLDHGDSAGNIDFVARSLLRGDRRRSRQRPHGG